MGAGSIRGGWFEGRRGSPLSKKMSKRYSVPERSGAVRRPPLRERGGKMVRDLADRVNLLG